MNMVLGSPAQGDDEHDDDVDCYDEDGEHDDNSYDDDEDGYDGHDGDTLSEDKNYTGLCSALQVERFRTF